jgi:hypothetical protein
LLVRGDAAPLHRDIVRCTHREMTAALLAWHADREMTTVLRDHHGTWMQKRRTGDEAMLAARAGQRLVHAAAVSAERRRHAANATRLRRASPDEDTEVRPYGLAGASVRILAGICIVPPDA